jgi:flagellar biosynthesis GTPase FlhF
MIEALEAFLQGVLTVLHALLLPTDPVTGAVSWALLPSQPIKLLVWAGLLFATLPGVFRMMVAPVARARKQASPTQQARQATAAAQRAQQAAAQAERERRQAAAAQAAQAAAIAAQERRQAERAAEQQRQAAAAQAEQQRQAEQEQQRQAAEQARQAALEAQQRQPTTTPAQVGKKAKGRSTGRTLMTDAGELVEGITERRRKTHALYRVDGGYALATTDGRMVASFTNKDDGMAALDAAAPTKQKPRKATKPDAPQAAPSAADRSHSRAFGSDPSRICDFRYRVVELDELIASNTDQGGVNPAYDPIPFK